MNIIVSALHHDGFAATVAEHRPTMLQFFELVLGGKLPHFTEEVADMLRMREGMDRVQEHPLASKAVFVVLPAQEWEWNPSAADAVPVERFEGSWTHVRRHNDVAILVPDDGDMANFNIALFLPQSSAEVTELTPVSFDPKALSVETKISPCAEGYVTMGDKRRGTCVNNGCPGRCKLKARIEKCTLTYQCPCS